MRPAAERLDFAQETYRSAASSGSVIRYRRQSVTNIGFYNGDRQWSEQEKYERARLGKPTMTFNVIRSKVEFVASLETFAKHNYMPKSVTRLPEHLDIERGLKYYCYNVLSMLDV